ADDAVLSLRGLPLRQDFNSPNCIGSCPTGVPKPARARSRKQPSKREGLAGGVDSHAPLEVVRCKYQSQERALAIIEPDGSLFFGCVREARRQAAAIFEREANDNASAESVKRRQARFGIERD